MNKIHFFLFLILVSCSYKKNPQVNEKNQGHEELYSEPDAPKSDDLNPKIKRIVIAATNDIEGKLTPTVQKFNDSHHPNSQKISLGGSDALGNYFKILRQHYQNVLLVDSGNIFSTQTPLKGIQDFYTQNNYDALTIGLGDFNLKLPAGVSSSSQLFKEFARSSSTPLVLSNLYDLKTARVVEWKGALPYLLKEVDGVKVGIIGLIPDDISLLTPIDNRVGLFVENMLQSTLRNARLLRSLGADLIVVISHQGIPCGHDIARVKNIPVNKVNFQPRKSGQCDLSKPLGIYMERLPPNLVDVVIGGRHKEKMANFVNETLLLSGFEHGKSFSYAEFFFDTETKQILKEKTIAHQPVMTCHEFFKETKDCYWQDKSVDHSKRIPATFLGQNLDLKLIAEKNLSQSQIKIDFQRALSSLEADLIYSSKASFETQLMRVKVKGDFLIRILEKEFNQKLDFNWIPSPFIRENSTLHLSISGDPINPSQHYTILADIESLQQHAILKTYINLNETSPLTEVSWSSYVTQDSVNTMMAAQTR